MKLKLFIFILMLLIPLGISATDVENSKIRIGLKLFRTILAADKNIIEKQTKDGNLQLVILYRYQHNKADEYAKKLLSLGKGKNKGKIKSLKIKVKPIHIDKLADNESEQTAGYYLIEDLDLKDIQTIREFGIKHHRITYSPFAQHVEQGISAGLMIEARLKPYINLKTLSESKIYLKEFFLKVARHVE